MTSTQPNRPTSTPKYVPPHRRLHLNYEDLHARYSPPNSPPLRMPRVQRSLSIQDLRHRFKREQDGSQGQDSPESPPPPSPPPPLPRDFEALRAHIQRARREQDGSQAQDSPELPPSPPSGSPFGHPRVPPPLQRPFLSPRFPDPPIFNGSGRANILFEDWKLRIKDKLTINKDHYPSEHSQIAYVITRLGGKAIEHTLRRRRTNSYHSVDELLSQLGDVYELSDEVVEEEDREAFVTLEQGDRPFLEFYSDFIKHAPRYCDDRNIAFQLRSKVNYKLRKRLAMQPIKNESFQELRDRLMLVDHLIRSITARKAAKKADRFQKQLAMASMESQLKKPGKYSIIPRPDPEEFRR